MSLGPEASSVPDLSVFMNYEYEVDVNGDNALAYVLQLTGREKRVLEVGAGSGMMTKHLVSSHNCSVVALEVNPSSIEKLKKFTGEVYGLDLNKPDCFASISKEGKFDTIIAADVLEHLYDPWTVLRNMTKLLKEDGSVVLSLPHVSHSAAIAALINEDFAYREWGLFDKTHIRFFGLHNIHSLHACAGLSIVDVRFVRRQPQETEFADTWSQLPRAVQTALLRSHNSDIYQVVTRAVRTETQPEIEVDILEAAALSMPKPKSYWQKFSSMFGR